MIRDAPTGPKVVPSVVLGALKLGKRGFIPVSRVYPIPSLILGVLQPLMLVLRLVTRGTLVVAVHGRARAFRNKRKIRPFLLPPALCNYATTMTEKKIFSVYFYNPQDSLNARQFGG